MFHCEIPINIFLLKQSISHKNITFQRAPLYSSDLDVFFFLQKTDPFFEGSVGESATFIWRACIRFWERTDQFFWERSDPVIGRV